TCVLRSVMEIWVFSLERTFHTRVSFRIYRETLSRVFRAPLHFTAIGNAPTMTACRSNSSQKPFAPLGHIARTVLSPTT
ncbi:hypothetical protein ABLN64_05400, partial [Mycobacterium tuberculosis]